MCLGVLTALATTAAAGFLGDPAPQQSVPDAGRGVVHRGDSFEVTVHTVSDVDLFEGVEPATGLFFHAQVVGVGRIADCWLPESRATAQNLLRGKTVRLTVKKDVDSDSDRIAVDVQLPNGLDYAQTLVHDGMAPADPSSRDELAAVETVARKENRGLWAAACTRIETAPSTTTSSSTPAPTTTTTTTPPVITTETTAPRPPKPPVTTTPPDDEWDDDIWLGKICFKEGARRTSPNGEEMVCARNGRNQLRWRRAD